MRAAHRLSLPLQAPEAVHEVALLEDQLSVVLPPLETMVGSALIVTVGAVDPVDGAALTVTVAVWVVLPPVPEHVNIYLAVVLRGPVDFVPLVDIVPAQAPDPEQAVAFVEFHVNVADWPGVSCAGVDDMATAGLDAVEVLNPVAVGVPVPVVFTPEPQADKPDARPNTSGNRQFRIRNCIREIRRGSIIRLCICSTKSRSSLVIAAAFNCNNDQGHPGLSQMSRSAHVANWRHPILRTVGADGFARRGHSR